MLHLFTDLINGWVVYPERMRANLNSTGGAIFSQRAMLALVDAGLDRQRAYSIVQRCAMRAWDQGGHLREYLRGEPEVTERLSESQIDELFDVAYHLRHIDAAFERLGLLSPATALVGAKAGAG
jgi:adenylosuccinate lyase